jgi:hypothetical protein
VFVAVKQNPNHRGAVSEMAITLAALQVGIEVYKPSSEHARADLVFEVDGQLLRVQCKTAARRGDTLSITLVSCWHGPRGYVRRPYTRAEVDLLAAYSPELGQAYLIPFSEIEGMQGFTLRLAPPGNGQRAGLHYAADYEFPGAVAQLGEHLHGMQGVVGSSPISSIEDPEPQTKVVLVGAHEFRNRFGWYMERAAAGETIRISRHGTARVELRAVPAVQLPLADAA